MAGRRQAQHRYFGLLVRLCREPWSCVIPPQALASPAPAQHDVLHLASAIAHGRRDLTRRSSGRDEDRRQPKARAGIAGSRYFNGSGLPTGRYRHSAASGEAWRWRFLSDFGLVAPNPTSALMADHGVVDRCQHRQPTLSLHQT